jgi:hypothetical protein
MHSNSNNYYLLLLLSSSLLLLLLLFGVRCYWRCVAKQSLFTSVYMQYYLFVTNITANVQIKNKSQREKGLKYECINKKATNINIYQLLSRPTASVLQLQYSSRIIIINSSRRGWVYFAK